MKKQMPREKSTTVAVVTAAKTETPSAVASSCSFEASCWRCLLSMKRKTKFCLCSKVCGIRL